ncbi:MAG: hypothetical protein CMM94_03325 [Rickettsiales bacterium]|mgnify:FL=1|nr:hypothetical protein [Rickettsiales bacterium]
MAQDTTTDQPDDQEQVSSWAQRVSEPQPHKRKAGIFIFGDTKPRDEDGKRVRDEDGEKTSELKVLAPWTEGNFSTDGRKAYLIPKGTIDEGEDVKEAAIREVAEETGIFLDEIPNDPRPESERRYLYDPSNPKHVEWKESGEDKFYPGAEIKCWLADGEPVFDGMLPTNRGNPAHHIMYGVKVKGIETLHEYIKHRDNGPEGKPVVKHKAIDLVEQQADTLPTFEQLLETLRTGYWNGVDDRLYGRLFDPNFKETEKYYLWRQETANMNRAVNELIQQQGDSISLADARAVISDAKERFEKIEKGEIKIETPEQLDDLFQTTSIQNTIKDDLKAIRKFMEGQGKYGDVFEKIGMEPLINDAKGFKMDTKQHPLRYYQESADIIPAEEYLERMVSFAEENEGGQYHCSQFNRMINDRAPGRRFKGERSSIADVVVAAVEAADQESKADLETQQDDSKWNDLKERVDALASKVRFKNAESSRSVA